MYIFVHFSSIPVPKKRRGGRGGEKNQKKQKGETPSCRSPQIQEIGTRQNTIPSASDMSKYQSLVFVDYDNWGAMEKIQDDPTSLTLYLIFYGGDSVFKKPCRYVYLMKY